MSSAPLSRCRCRSRPTPRARWISRLTRAPAAAALAADKVTCVVQVKGKVRDRLEVDPGISETELEKLALAAPGVIRTLDGRGVRKVIVRAPKLVSIVPE